MFRPAIMACCALLFVACTPDSPIEPKPEIGPTAHLIVPSGGVEGAAVTVDGSRSTGDSIEYAWEFGDGSAGSRAHPQHTYPDNGRYRVTLIVTDRRERSDTATATIDIANAPPIISTLTVPGGLLAPKTAITIHAAFSDPGVNDSLTATVDWGDQQQSTLVSGDASHVYAADGEYAIRLIVRDNDGGITARTAGAVTVSRAASDFEIIDLGTLGGNSAAPFAINDQGQVVGHSSTASGELHAFLWEDGAIRDLAPDRRNTSATIITNSGIIGGDEWGNPNATILTWIGGVTSVVPGDEGGAWIADVSEAGVLVGSASDTHHGRSFIWSGGVRRPLAGLPAPRLGSSDYSWARAMNDAGQIVGSSEVNEYAGVPISHAVIWVDGAIRDLGLLGERRCDSRPEILCGQSDARDINNNGVVAGWSSDSSAYPHAVVWSNGTIRDLERGWALAINDAGDVLTSKGYVNDRSSDPTLWHDNTAIPIGSLGGRGTMVSALSESGSVIGASVTATGSVHAFVWRRDRGMVDLGTGPAGTGRYAVAVAMNSRGDIIGYTATCSTSEYGGMVSLSCGFDDESRAILWRRK